MTVWHVGMKGNENTKTADRFVVYFFFFLLFPVGFKKKEGHENSGTTVFSFIHSTDGEFDK